MPTVWKSCCMNQQGTGCRGCWGWRHHYQTRRCRRGKSRCSHFGLPTYQMLCSASGRTVRRTSDVEENIGHTRTRCTLAPPRQASRCQADIRNNSHYPRSPQIFLGCTRSRSSYQQSSTSRLRTSCISSFLCPVQKNLERNSNNCWNSCSSKLSPWRSWRTAGRRNPRAH